MDADEAAITVLRNRTGEFAEVQYVTAGHAGPVSSPFPVEIDPAELVAGP